MVLTGWDADQLARQPAPVVRALMWRVFASAAWEPGLAAAAHSPLPPGASFDERMAKSDAQDALAVTESVLFGADG
jgi:hypothetical protein